MSLVGIVILLIFLLPDQVAGAPGDIGNCSVPFSLSDSEGLATADPFILSDPAGVTHLFWADRTSGEPGTFGPPDAVMYSVWDGETWSEPIDIHLSPPDHFNRQILGIRGVMDDQGIIHLIWMGPDNTFYYSSARADQASNASAWQTPLELADDQSAVQYSVAIAYEPPQTLHIIYGKSPEGQSRSVAYIRSEDRGENWSEPVDIYIFSDPERGASNTRVIYHPPNNLYATWTEWDSSGNGQAILFARSLDSGNSWQFPVILDERTGDEYERDWANLTVLDDGRLIVFWEGGFRAYPQAQYSADDGVTWSEPIDTFYYLIADNGYVNFAKDGDGRLHSFVSRRIREGHDYVCTRVPGGCDDVDYTNALWHSIWKGSTIWEDPLPVNGFGNVEGVYSSIGGNYHTVAINNGNQVVAAWFDYSYYEIIVMQCEIEGASALAPQPWPTVTPTQLVMPTPISSETTIQVSPTPDPTPTVFLNNTELPPSKSNYNPSLPMFLGIIPAVAIIVLIVFVQKIKIRNY